MNIFSKCQLSSSSGLGLTVFWASGKSQVGCVDKEVAKDLREKLKKPDIAAVNAEDGRDSIEFTLANEEAVEYLKKTQDQRR